MFFESMRGVARVVVIAAAFYSILIVPLRISGKRTLAKSNAFDFVITVALGSTLATVLLSPEESDSTTRFAAPGGVKIRLAEVKDLPGGVS